ncbi:MAG: PDZ domain-containing protein, partial [Chthoniobacteraceae bacterium]
NDVEPAPEDRKDEEKNGDKPGDESENKGDAGEKKKEEGAATPAGSTAIEATKDGPDKTGESKMKDAEQKKKDEKPKAVEIDLEDFEQRAVVLPPGTGHFADLFATPGKVYFTRYPLAGSDSKERPLAYYDLEKREEKRVLGDLDGLELSADGKKLLVVNKGSWFITGTGENQKLDQRVSTGGLEFTVDPRAEWHQLFADAWRIERDFFYDPNLHGVDWEIMRQRYGKLIEEANTRWDVNFILGELLGELNVSHAYRSGGDTEGSSNRSVGYLGCDFALDQGAYRISHIPQVAPWEYSVRSPLLAPGVKVSEGDWILAVNGIPIDPSRDPWAAFQGLANQTVILTVNDKPATDGARDVLVDTIASEDWLRQYAWMEENRLRVDKLSGGRVGYIYVRDTQQEGQNQLYRQFRAQFMKPGLIIDERWNSGGQIPDRFIELLARKVTNYWGVRDGHDWQTPTIAHDGPKAMLANGWSGSGGDCFPWLFRENKLGPVIGTRTWGGLIGMTGAPQLIDGGRVTVPTFGIYDREGHWIIEGHGVDPDIEVIDDPAAMSRGGDPQLERAVVEVLKSLDDKPRAVPKKPVYPNRAGAKFTQQPD